MLFSHRQCILWMLLVCVQIGKSTSEIDLNTLSGPNGFTIKGATAGDYSGASVCSAGDVNNDGVDDIIVGAYWASPMVNNVVRSIAGISYVIFGRSIANGMTNSYANVDLLALNSAGSSVGFAILGAVTNDNSGFVVSAASDVNNDGIDDVIVSAVNGDPVVKGISRDNAGITYVVFGRSYLQGATSYTNIDLAVILSGNSPLGFAIYVAVAGDSGGRSASGAGDVNGDGVQDLIVAVHRASPMVNGVTRTAAGVTYVIFGRDAAHGPLSYATIDLLNITTTGNALGFAIYGAAASDNSGMSVSSAGDINHDGVEDVIVGSYLADVTVDSVTRSTAGKVYVVFGRSIHIYDVKDTYSNIDLATMAQQATLQGFAILGAATTDNTGYCVSKVGDVNGDGIDDVIIGTPLADPAVDGVVRLNSGVSYVIYGTNNCTNIDLAWIITGGTVARGFAMLGAAGADRTGWSVSGAGDVNGDGVNDMIIGAWGHSPTIAGIARTSAGVSYVVYGRHSTNEVYSIIDLSTFARSDQYGYRILGSASYDRSGWSVSSAGDVNQDGLADVIVGAYQSAVSGTDSGASYVIFGAYSSPTSQPSSQPTNQPSRQPSAQPMERPSSQPSSQPSSMPSAQPSAQPSARPSMQPASRPSAQPSTQPVSCPTSLPSSKPSSPPSAQPSVRPSVAPSSQPTSSPSSQPSGQPSRQPSSCPSSRPSSQPSSQPSAQPSSQPMSRPSAQPSFQPLAHPSRQPTRQPTGQPSSQPSARPSDILSAQPTTQPSAQPSAQSSLHPTMQPSSRPSSQPSSMPSCQPSSVPSSRPSSSPSCQPILNPSHRTSAPPTSTPTSQPTGRPSAPPSGHPSIRPSMVSAPLSTQPTVQPSAQPSGSPSAQPTVRPSTQPSAQPSTMPSVHSVQPTKVPVVHPTMEPSWLPSHAPATQPSQQPRAEPSGQPTAALSVRPTLAPTGEWATVVSNTSVLTEVAYPDEHVWACGDRAVPNTALCVLAAPKTGKVMGQYTLPWASITSVVTSVSGTVMINRRITTSNKVVTSEVATCAMEQRQLYCKVISAADTTWFAASFVRYSNTIVHVGWYNTYTSISMLNVTSGTVLSHVYTANGVKALALSHVQSPPAFLGSFVAGTAIRAMATPVNCILAGMVRTDNGVLRAMSLLPVSGSILNNADLVNAMALEFTGPDSFIAGGLQLGNVAGTHAYLLRVNALYSTISFGVRYRSQTNGQSVVKGMVLVDATVFMILAHTSNNVTALTVLKASTENGAILKEVHVNAPYATHLHCTDIAYLDLLLTTVCSVTHGDVQNRSILIAFDQELSFTVLPMGFMRGDQSLFTAETIAFQRTVLTITQTKATSVISTYEFSTAVPTRRPSSTPSTQPSSSPTAAPSVSARPTSQPSSAVPTISHRPTVSPTVLPTMQPTAASTARPITALPTVRLTPTPSIVPTVAPQQSPSARPTTVPTPRPSVVAPVLPTVAPTVSGEGGSNDLPAYAVGASVGLGLIILCYGVYHFYKHDRDEKAKDKRREEYHRQQAILSQFRADVVPLDEDGESTSGSSEMGDSGSGECSVSYSSGNSHWRSSGEDSGSECTFHHGSSSGRGAYAFGPAQYTTSAPPSPPPSPLYSPSLHHSPRYSMDYSPSFSTLRSRLPSSLHEPSSVMRSSSSDYHISSMQSSDIE